MRQRLIGLPGTGKTTRLLDILEKEILVNHSANQVIYCSFSNAAVNEAKERVLAKFDSIEESDLIYYRTMHSLCKYLLQDRKILNGSNPATTKDFRYFIEEYSKFSSDFSNLLEKYKIRVSVQGWYHTEDRQNALSEYTLGHEPEKFFRHILNYIRAKYGTTPKDGVLFQPYIKSLYEDLNFGKDEFSQIFTQLMKLEPAWNVYKKTNDLFEFAELLISVLQNHIVPEASVLIVDEYQDSSVLQAQLVDMWSEAMELTIVAGDPNQAIYGFNGASPMYLENFNHDRNILLDQTWRCPTAVVEYAKKILHNSWTKGMVAATNKEGKVFRSELENIDYSKYDSIYILARNSSMLDRARQELINSGQFCLDQESTPLIFSIYKLYYAISEKVPVRGRVLADILKLSNERCYNLFDQQARSFIIEMMKKKKTDIKIDYDKLIILLGDKNTSIIIERLENVLSIDQLGTFAMLKQREIEPQRLLKDMAKFKFMTIHKSKGREAELVVIIDEASWYEQQGLEDEDEEYRLHFVAATRSKQDLAIVSLKDQSKSTKYLPEI